MRERKKIKVALVGTDSLRGKEIKSVLGQKRFPIEKIDFFDPDVEEEYSKLTQFREEPKVIHHLDKESLLGMDLVFLAADKKVNYEYGLLAREKRFWAVDLSETFNAEEAVPVVVAGVNDSLLLKGNPGLIANPHPVTIALSHLYSALLEEFGILKAISFVLQPVSAFDKSGIEELANQSYSVLSSTSLSKKVFREQIAFNLLSGIDRPDKNGFSPAEKQVTLEIRRVLKARDFLFSLSIIQAPVFHTYSIMNYLELDKKADIQGLKGLFKKYSFFKISLQALSSPVSVAGKDEIFIGSIKREQSLPNSFWIWTVTDNLTRGSALNAFEIAQKIFSVPFV
jgi:aspartate-semialdehyde dehydrogenase